MKVPAAKVVFTGQDIEAIKKKIEATLKSGMLTLHENTRKFEQEFSSYIGSSESIAVNSGTSALEIILRAINVTGKEVIIPTDTFAATIFAALGAGAKVRLCDIDEYFSIDPDKLKGMISKNTKAVVIVHIAGIISPRIEEIRKLCAEKSIFLIEDAAHAHGSAFKEKKAGSIGDAAAFSFYPTKVMTSAEGGMITTNSKEIAGKARMLRDQGKENFSSNNIVCLGYNWRMSEIHAIIGSSQFSHINEFIKSRREIAALYDKELNNAPGLSLLKIPKEIKSNYYKYILLINDSIDRQKLKSIMKEKYEVSLSGEVYDVPCHLQPAFSGLGYKKGDFPNAERLCKSHICLPIYAGMPQEEALHAADSLKKALAEFK